MPFKSKAQQRYAYATKQPWAKEFSDETKKLKKGKKRGFAVLPDRVSKSAFGVQHSPYTKRGNRERAAVSGGIGAGGIGGLLVGEKLSDRKYNKDFSAWNSEKDNHNREQAKGQARYNQEYLNWDSRRQQHRQNFIDDHDKKVRDWESKNPKHTQWNSSENARFNREQKAYIDWKNSSSKTYVDYGSMPENKRGRYDAVKAKAERPGTPQEGAAFRAKQQEWEKQYGVQHKTGRGPEPKVTAPRPNPYQTTGPRPRMHFSPFSEPAPKPHVNVPFFKPTPLRSTMHGGVGMVTGAAVGAGVAGLGVMASRMKNRRKKYA